MNNFHLALSDFEKSAKMEYHSLSSEKKIKSYGRVYLTFALLDSERFKEAEEGEYFKFKPVSDRKPNI